MSLEEKIFMAYSFIVRAICDHLPLPSTEEKIEARTGESYNDYSYEWLQLRLYFQVTFR